MKKRVNIWIDAELHNIAKNLGLNVSRVCERGLEASVNLLLQKNIGSAYELPNRFETKEVTDKEVKETPKVEQPEPKEVSEPEHEEEELEEEEEEEEEKGIWSCPHERLILKKQKTIDDCRVCPYGKVDTCKNIEESVRKELIAERAEKSEETEKKGSPKQEEPEEKPKGKPKGKPKEKPKEKLAALQEEKPITQNITPIPEKPLSTTSTPIIAPQPQEPSVIEETDIEAQQAAKIKAIRDRLEKKPPGQQKLGEE